MSYLHLDDLIDLIDLLVGQELLHHQTLLVGAVSLAVIFFVSNDTINEE